MWIATDKWWKKIPSKEKRVVEEKDAAIITDMLESVITGGTGGNAAIGRPAAGKTGTTDDEKDAWFVGYTPDLVAAVWIGDDYGSETLGITGGSTPAVMWRQFMSAALANTLLLTLMYLLVLKRLSARAIITQ